MACRNYFLHVGMCKTGTTFVQQEIFPRWPGVTYLEARHLEFFVNLPPGRRYLVSCEGLTGRMFGDLDEKRSSLARLAEMFPGARCIIGVRRHDAYLQSLYSQYLRYGGSGDFEEFIDLDGRTGDAFVSVRDYLFEPVIREAEERFGEPPFVFDNTELREHLDDLLADLAALLGTDPPQLPARGARPRNVGLGRVQGGLLKRLNASLGVRPSRTGRHRPYPTLRRWRVDPPRVCHDYLGWLPSESLLDSEVRERVNRACAKDWAFVEEYLRRCPWRHRGAASANAVEPRTGAST